MTTTPRTWNAGETVDDIMMNTEIRDQFNSIFAAWTSYTPTWTASTNPVLGNGTLIGRYLKVGRTCTLHINLTTGSTTTYGSGNYAWSLPFASANAGCTYIGHAHLLSGSTRWMGQFVISPASTSASPFFPANSTTTTAAFMQPTVPVTLASGHQLRITIQYETAS